MYRRAAILYTVRHIQLTEPCTRTMKLTSHIKESDVRRDGCNAKNAILVIFVLGDVRGVLADNSSFLHISLTKRDFPLQNLIFNPLRSCFDQFMISLWWIFRSLCRSESYSFISKLEVTISFSIILKKIGFWRFLEGRHFVCYGPHAVSIMVALSNNKGVVATVNVNILHCKH